MDNSSQQNASSVSPMQAVLSAPIKMDPIPIIPPPASVEPNPSVSNEIKTSSNAGSDEKEEEKEMSPWERIEALADAANQGQNNKMTDEDVTKAFESKPTLEQIDVTKAPFVPPHEIPVDENEGEVSNFVKNAVLGKPIVAAPKVMDFTPQAPVTKIPEHLVPDMIGQKIESIPVVNATQAVTLQPAKEASSEEVKKTESVDLKPAIPQPEKIPIDNTSTMDFSLGKKMDDAATVSVDISKKENKNEESSLSPEEKFDIAKWLEELAVTKTPSEILMCLIKLERAGVSKNERNEVKLLAAERMISIGHSESALQLILSVKE